MMAPQAVLSQPHGDQLDEAEPYQYRPSRFPESGLAGGGVRRDRRHASKAAAQADRVDEKDAQAQSLGYKHDATKVDKAKFAKYVAGQNCANCTFYQGKPTDAWGACPIFAGKQVAAKGWCSAYVKKA